MKINKKRPGLAHFYNNLEHIQNISSRLDSDEVMVVVGKNVIVPHYCH